MDSPSRFAVKFIQYHFRITGVNLLASLLLYTWTESLKKCYSLDFLAAFLILLETLVKVTLALSQSIV